VAENHNPYWSQRIPNKWLKKEWRSILAVVQKYITYEGRFSTIHYYHIRILMHLNGDKEMNLPFYLLKSLTKMAKRIQSHPQTALQSLFHQGLIKILVMYALSEVQVSWKQRLSSLGFEEQVSKTQKTTPDKKTRISTRKGNTSKSTSKVQEEASPIMRETRSSKRNLALQQEESAKHKSKSCASKQEFVGIDRVYTKRRTRKMTQELHKIKTEHELEIHDIPVKKSP
jgi:hypothetical protein